MAEEACKVELPSLQSVELGKKAMRGKKIHDQCSLILRGGCSNTNSPADLPSVKSFVSEGDSFRYPYIVAVERVKWKGVKLPGSFKNSNNPFIKSGILKRT